MAARAGPKADSRVVSPGNVDVHAVWRRPERSPVYSSAPSAWRTRQSEGVHVDAVLGLSMTPTSVGMVLVEGHEADGAPADRDAFEVQPGTIHTPEQAAAAVRRTEALAATRGVRLHSIGVTWSEDADDQASLLMQSLSESGFDNVVPIRLPEATEALARGIADVIGHQTTAVCVIEPETVITLIVHADDQGAGAVQTAVNHAIDSDESLISWLSAVFTRADWQPEALVVVGSAGGFDDLLPLLEDALSVPVFSPAEAELALARGAALASASNIDLPFADYAAPDQAFDGPRPDAARRPRWHAGAVTMLVAGVLTFVVSVSVAISLELTPREQPPQVQPAQAVEAPQPPAARQVAPPPVARPAPPPAAPVLPPPLPEAPPPIAEAPVADTPVEAPYVEEPAAPQLPAAVAPAPTAAPVPVISPYEPPQKPLRTRIMDRLRGIGDPDPVEQAPVVPYVPAGAPPAG